jgi:protein-S-isoprenylcysteine O-methyltransferase Ste14
MRPMFWVNRRVRCGAIVILAWHLSIELGTSRARSRVAAGADRADEQVIDTATSRWFELAATTALVGATSASLSCRRGVIRHQRTAVVAGLVLLVGSGALSTAARRHLGRFHRDSLTVHGDHELVDSGPYRIVRHPLYVATIGVFVGLGATLGHWLSVAFAMLPAGALIHRIRVEEAMLGEALGESYDAYRRRTRRLVPGVW